MFSFETKVFDDRVQTVAPRAEEYTADRRAARAPANDHIGRGASLQIGAPREEDGISRTQLQIKAQINTVGCSLVEFDGQQVDAIEELARTECSRKKCALGYPGDVCRGESAAVDRPGGHVIPINLDAV